MFLTSADDHFFWGSIMYGYLVYDTIFTLMFYSAVGSLAFVLHHCLGLVCCCFGLYFNKMALFGTAIQVFFEGTTPLLHLMGCLKLMGREGTKSYTAIGVLSIYMRQSHMFLSSNSYLADTFTIS